MVLASLVLLPGCGGCRQDPDEAAEEEQARIKAQQEKAKKERKPDFEFGALLSEPYEPLRDRKVDVRPCLCKPGHWMSTTVAARSNYLDFLGDLETVALDNNGVPVGLSGMGFSIAMLRQAALPKEQTKSLATTVFLPKEASQARLLTQLTHRFTGRPIVERPHFLKRMPSYQHQFVVLARTPERYSYLKTLSSVKNPIDVEFNGQDEFVYRFSLLPGDRPCTLPSYALYWTTIAYLLWDDADPDMLRPDQQTALLDWLHWGGQIILSGADSLETLRHSFLEPYLPATSDGPRKIAREELSTISDRWSLPGRKHQTIALCPTHAWAGVKFVRHPEGHYVPGTGDLLVERRVGRGRIVVTAFSLAQSEFRGWKGSFDGFFNACVLRRPARVFREDKMGQINVNWIGEGGTFCQDPRVYSSLWYFTRDEGRTFQPPREEGADQANQFGFSRRGQPATAREAAGVSDVASWNDYSLASNTARASLKNAAQVHIPNRTFVVTVLAVYLVVLVPVNWLVFRLLGRVEWAWAAAPLVAIASTGIVIRLARLDIGFARSASEIAVAEVQGSYSRAHVTRYTALYTSLATKYNIRFEDPGALAQPFPTQPSPEGFKLAMGESLMPLKLRLGTDVALEGFAVSSNSTSLTHSEQMVDLGGSIALVKTAEGGYEVLNSTPLPIEGAGVIRRIDAGRVEAAWLGTIKPGASVPLKFQPVASGHPALAAMKGDHPKDKPLPSYWKSQRDASPRTAGGRSAGELNLRNLLAQAETLAGPVPGETRLVAWIDGPVPGQQIVPEAPQGDRATVVVAHLAFALPPRPQRDQNTVESISKASAADDNPIEPPKESPPGVP